MRQGGRSRKYRLTLIAKYGRNAKLFTRTDRFLRAAATPFNSNRHFRNYSLTGHATDTTESTRMTLFGHESLKAFAAQKALFVVR